MSKTYRNEACSAIHETAESLFKNGIIDSDTMRDFDESCLVAPPVLTANEIKILREKENDI